MTILFLEKYEAGIVLARHRGKISANGKMQHTRSRLSGLESGEMYIYGMHISSV